MRRNSICCAAGHKNNRNGVLLSSRRSFSKASKASNDVRHLNVVDVVP